MRVRQRGLQGCHDLKERSAHRRERKGRATPERCSRPNEVERDNRPGAVMGDEDQVAVDLREVSTSNP